MAGAMGISSCRRVLAGHWEGDAPFSPCYGGALREWTRCKSVLLRSPQPSCQRAPESRKQNVGPSWTRIQGMKSPGNSLWPGSGQRSEVRSHRGGQAFSTVVCKDCGSHSQYSGNRSRDREREGSEWLPGGCPFPPPALTFGVLLPGSKHCVPVVRVPGDQRPKEVLSAGLQPVGAKGLQVSGVATPEDAPCHCATSCPVLAQMWPNTVIPGPGLQHGAGAG